MTLYLKYRPQNISQLHLTEVRQNLEAMLKSGKMPHAWLFTGPWGTGKTSVARILAKAVNCTNKKGIEPCNECELCREITLGQAVDIIEIDAASNRGIDEIRELRDKVRLAPMKAKNKVYIIDEVHMLTTEAANALLKTLEEPPENTIFALCTTEPEKMLPTVKSRCVWVKFKKPSLHEAIASLEFVLKGEKAEYDKEGLELLAVAAKGSFRDGTKILEQVLMSKGKADGTSVKEILGWTQSADPEEFIKQIGLSNRDKALEIVREVSDQGGSIKNFIERAVEGLRINLFDSLKQKNITQTEQILKLITGLETAYARMKNSVIPQLPLEIFVIENTTDKIVENNLPEEKKVEKPKPPVEEEKVVIKGEVGVLKLDDVTAKWADIMKAVRPMNHSVEALLRSTKPMEFDGERLTLEVFYKFHKDKLETEKCRQIVEGAVGSVFGISPVKLALKLGDKKNKSSEVSGTVDEDIIKAAEAIFKAEAV